MLILLGFCNYCHILFIYFSSTLPLLIFYFNSIDLMLPYSLTLAGYSSITVPYWELLVVV